MELHAIATRSVFAFVFLSLMLRFSSKETVSQLSGRTLVVTLIMSDLIDDFAFGSVSAGKFVAAAGSLVIIAGVVSLLAVYSNRVYGLVEGDPLVLLDTTGLKPTRMRRQRINDKELESLLRAQGIDRSEWMQLQAVRLEREGQASMTQRDWAKPATRRDLTARRSA